MEKNCVEALKNNFFGALNVIELCEQYGDERFMIIFTDKAVKPTNVMGAKKRMCEQMIRTNSSSGNTKYSATRFGSALGSSGSVILLFKKNRLRWIYDCYR